MLKRTISPCRQQAYVYSW